MIFVGLMDDDGVESFLELLLKGDVTSRPSTTLEQVELLGLRARYNTQRNVILYKVELEEDQLDTIEELLHFEDFKGAADWLKAHPSFQNVT